MPGKLPETQKNNLFIRERIEDPQIWTSNEKERSFPPSQVPFEFSSQSAFGGDLEQSIHLPNYIKPFPSTTEPEDLQYLQMKGVLELPDKDLRDACVRCYLEHVQPIYPVVDSATIVSLLEGTTLENDKLSLLVLYALVFVGGTWVDVRLVRKLGFLSRIAFRRSIHKKMRLLYDADYENDRVCLIQTFILWTFWFEGPNEIKDSWYWIGLALSFSRVIGLHKAPSDTETHPATNQHRRRLWWCLATREVICAFALSRRPRVADNDHNISMLGIEDFEFHQTPGISPPQQRSFAQICVLYVKLVSIFGKICKAAYPESGSGKTSVLYSSQQLEGTDSISSITTMSITDQLKLFQNHLDEWRRNVPDEVWHTGNLSLNPNGTERIAQVHRGLLTMMYYTTVMILHRPQVTSIDAVICSLGASQKSTTDPSREMVRFAARHITQTAMDFYQEDLVESLSATCISCLILASISHIFDMMSNEQIFRSEAHQRLDQCKAVLHAFSEQQIGAQWGLEVINYIVFRLKHQHRRHKLDFPISQRAVDSINFNRRNGILAGNSTVSPEHVQTTNLSRSIDQAKDGALGVLASTEAPLTSEIMNIASFPISRQPFGSCDSLLQSLNFDQAMPDNLMNFIGPDLAWLDLPDSSENLDGIGWSGSDYV
ncbi:uncharacterized protein A1O9_09831 [Exophiala aquamarina CBS 119918]|uniref:Xylanolytic transcriptional activator regulatory domain-containing protein n=1 Tax=Exophiala aquamarina CBS 119918 TaxID=1182545 RepID=A0A072P2E7_9EURO|nr:uncharacterized protein A1O9_09831 [Exophiala aquamarina CBS 119918]KEF54036.1 hypothetical protein A1O9_09831 [Exophiala aquamarina CBS 119918]